MKFNSGDIVIYDSFLFEVGEEEGDNKFWISSDGFNSEILIHGKLLELVSKYEERRDLKF